MFGVNPLVCKLLPTVTDAFADAVNVATRFVTFVFVGTVNVMFVPLILPDTPGFVKLKAVISQALLNGCITLTVTIYVFTVPSSAVTVYVSGDAKVFGVAPLVCKVLPTFTDAFADAVNVATRFVTFVFAGTVNVMLVPLKLPDTAGFVKLNAVISQALLND